MPGSRGLARGRRMASRPNPDRSRGTGTSGRPARSGASVGCRIVSETARMASSHSQPRWPSSFSRWLKSCSSRIVSLKRPHRSTTTRRSRGMPSSSRARCGMSGKSDGTCTTNSARSTPLRSVVNGSAGQLRMRLAVDGDLVAQRAAGLDPLVDRRDAPRPRIDASRRAAASSRIVPECAAAGAAANSSRAQRTVFASPASNVVLRLPAEDRSCPIECRPARCAARPAGPARG